MQLGSGSSSSASVAAPTSTLLATRSAILPRDQVALLAFSDFGGLAAAARGPRGNGQRGRGPDGARWPPWARLEAPLARALGHTWGARRRDGRHGRGRRWEDVLGACVHMRPELRSSWLSMTYVHGVQYIYGDVSHLFFTFEWNFGENLL